MACSKQEVLLEQDLFLNRTRFSHQGVSFTGLSGMRGAGASQALISGWVSEEQLKTAPFVPHSVLVGSWLGRVGSALISPGLCFLGHPCPLFQPCCFCTLEALDAAGPAACGPLISLSPRAAAQLCLTSLGLWGLPCSPGMGREPRAGCHCHSPACSGIGDGIWELWLCFRA